MSDLGVETGERIAWSGALAGKVVLVSGVGPDLGRSLVLRSAQAGADLVLAARDGARLEGIAEEVRALGRKALAVPTDVTDAGARRDLVAAAVDTFGHVDTLMNAAFIHPTAISLIDTDLDKMRSWSDLNVLASVGLVQELAPTLTARRGSVVLINSMVIRNRLAGSGAYRMDKAALLAAARSLSIDLGPQGVRVNSVAPGYIWGRRCGPGSTTARRRAGRRPRSPTTRSPTTPTCVDCRRRTRSLTPRCSWPRISPAGSAVSAST